VSLLLTECISSVVCTEFDQSQQLVKWILAGYRHLRRSPYVKWSCNLCRVADFIYSSGYPISESPRIILYPQGYARNGFRGSRWAARNRSNSRSRYVSRTQDWKADSDLSYDDDRNRKSARVQLHPKSRFLCWNLDHGPGVHW
jgi:hypothetical protein